MRTLDQGWVTSVLEGDCPTELSSNPNQTQLNKIIKVFRIARKLQGFKFLSGLEINSMGQ